LALWPARQELSCEGGGLCGVSVIRSSASALRGCVVSCRDRNLSASGGGRNGSALVEQRRAETVRVGPAPARKICDLLHRRLAGGEQVPHARRRPSRRRRLPPRREIEHLAGTARRSAGLPPRQPERKGRMPYSRAAESVGAIRAPFLSGYFGLDPLRSADVRVQIDLDAVGGRK